ncbi:MAG: helix-turn-helix transcriptional regulator [Gemmatimonadaceae bacterium]|nr:helix-turn-helix transcriptional regulator [Gemmatimonadaceae bacterium]
MESEADNSATASLGVTVARHSPQSACRQAVTGLDQRYSVIYVDAGSGSCRINGFTMHLEPGELIWLVPGFIWEPIRLAGASYWHLSFGGTALVDAITADAGLGPLLPAGMLSACGEENFARRKFRFAPNDGMLWGLRLERLAHELAQPRLGSAAAASAILQLLVIDVARVAQRTLAATSSERSPLVESAAAFIEKKFTAPISLADVSRAVGRSPSYLTELVRRETGQTVLQWIIARRMDEACVLLLSTELCVKDICTRIGYDDPGHFIRQFRRARGHTPQSWRELQRGARALRARRTLPPKICPVPLAFVNAASGRDDSRIVA